MSFAFTQTVTVLRGGYDQFGDPLPTADHAIDDCVFAPRGTPSEVTGQRDTVIYSDTLYLPPGADILATDQVRLSDDSVWQVDGPPSRYDGPGASPFTGWAPGVVAVLKRVTG